ncbi:MAG: hypothetical protein Roseis2KO_24050 [Roseivirga sp.]
MEEKLFTDFAAISRDEWQKKIVTDLKGKDPETLNWEVAGLNGGPIYTKEDLPEQLTDLANPHEQPAIFGARHWVNYQLIVVDTDKTANQQALEALNTGADGIIFKLDSQPAMNTLLADINTDYCHLSFIDNTTGSNLLEGLITHLEHVQADLSKVNGYYVGTASAAQASGKLPQYKLFNIKADKYEGGSPVTELALTLSKTAALFDEQTEAGMPIGTLLQHTQFELSLGTSYFTEVAKYRAMRGLALRFAGAYEVAVSTGDIDILASTGEWTEPIDDQHSYMLRATTEAMAAILGGTDALCIKPFYTVFEKGQKALAERSARNISNVLKEESYFNKVVDPASGSYFVEALTHDIMEQSWQLFLAMEAAGGYTHLTTDKIESLHQNLTA